MTKNEKGDWSRQALALVNRPSDPLLICGCTVDNENGIYVMGILNAKTGPLGVVYKVIGQ